MLHYLQEDVKTSRHGASLWLSEGVAVSTFTAYHRRFLSQSAPSKKPFNTGVETLV